MSTMVFGSAIVAMSTNLPASTFVGAATPNSNRSTDIQSVWQSELNVVDSVEASKRFSAKASAVHCVAHPKQGSSSEVVPEWKRLNVLESGYTIAVSQETNNGH